ncbi:acyl-CoA dehydrogenase family protein [Frankia sp. AgB1.9]|uniref:acyl-CoA dehydrogenase family protein n=1 Tax=unclassified Frankia TaxID=2632575 RepID=UPI001933273E|nr:MULTISPECIES: acyl-CoA dehydrogenase family protein [unclassified Frankia]MBL7488104.1 acyl-CoA dehydrogenase family protein [Frankia sp. AgW1.1]MBL7553262.1 acyl-CoA dehydrogenase family protein [Frankia sp. AgB1.9]MBL7624240.1 acyl-CoA dehydrogenase family protein [Frankia sp. AgB1.8]
MTDESEPIGEFRSRARHWLRANLPPATDRDRGPLAARSDEQELAEVAEERRIQRLLWDGGFAGICFPKEYGGLGLTPAHAAAFGEELAGYRYPMRMQVPTMTPCAAILLEFGTHEQKLAHIPAILRGEEFWMQFLSEPGSGSDLAGVRTSAERQGDSWVLNGSKIWTTGAWWSDWALCLARTNWDVPKHRGLTVFMLPIHQPGIEVSRIEMINGNKEFCQEFLTDVVVPADACVGQVDDGWTVATRWMFHERTIHSSPLAVRPVSADAGGEPSSGSGADLLRLAELVGRRHDPTARELVAEAHVLRVVSRELDRRVQAAIADQVATDQLASVSRLMHGEVEARLATIGFELAGRHAVVWADDDDERVRGHGTGYLVRQLMSIAGGTTEMARNAVAERVLGMPREAAPDRGLPFRDVRSTPSVRTGPAS